MAGVLEFVDIGPDFSLPGFIMNSGFAAGGATGVELADQASRDGTGPAGNSTKMQRTS